MNIIMQIKRKKEKKEQKQQINVSNKLIKNKINESRRNR